MTTFHTVEHDDFGSWVGLCRNKTTVGDNTEVYIDNPYYENSTIDDPGIENYFDLNGGLTPIHSCVVAGDDSKQIINDTHSTLLQGTDHTPVDEMILMGKLVQNNVGKTHFTHTTDSGNNPIDGFMQIIQPTWGAWSLNATDDTTTAARDIANFDQLSTRINLQFDNLAPFTWVPVWGFGYSNAWNGSNTGAAAPTMFERLNYTQHGIGEDIEYLNFANDYMYQRPHGITSSINNLRGESYGATGNNVQKDRSFYLLYCHDGQGNAMLASCQGMSPDGMLYDNTGGGGSVQRTSSQKNLCASNQYWNTHGGKIKYEPNTTLQNLFSTFDNNLQAIWDHYGANEFGGGRRVVLKQFDTGSTSYRYAVGRPRYVGNLSLIAYGASDNADLSSSENVYVNHLHVRSAASFIGGLALGEYGAKNITSTNADYYNSVHSYFITGKVGGLTFYNHPTVSTVGNSIYSNDVLHSPGPGRVLMHATSLGGCKIHDFSFGAHTPVTQYARQATQGVLADYFIPYSNHEFIFPGSGVTYNPVSELTSSSVFINQNDSWTAPINMFDAGVDTFSTANHVGAENALLVPLNGVKSGNTTPADNDPIEEFNILVRGIRQQDIKEYEIVCAITDSSQTPLVTATDLQRIKVGETGNLSTGASYPLNKSAYSCTFKSSDMTGITYGQIKGGYLKMYVNAVTTGNI